MAMLLPNPTGAGRRPRLHRSPGLAGLCPVPPLGSRLPVGTGTRTNMAAPSHQATYDAIVIGAGIQGSFTAYHLARRHRDTLLLEQFILPHSRGSSHGQSRITRSAYAQATYARMMPDSFHLWQQLEAEAGTSLYRQTGLMMLGPADNPELEGCRCSVSTNQILDAAALTQRFPGLRLHAGEVAVWDGTGGVLLADRALRAVQDVFRRHGGTLRDGEKVLRIEPGAVLTVTTTAGVYRAPRLIITAGAWTGALLAPLGLHLPLQPLRIDVCYWREKEPGSLGAGRLGPCFIAVGLSQYPHDIYGLPSLEYPGLVKVCYHHGSSTDPEERDRVPPGTPRPDIALLSSFISRYLPGLEPSPAVVETCLYTNTPDEDFILDRHPKFSNIIIGAGFSGRQWRGAPTSPQSRPEPWGWLCPPAPLLSAGHGFKLAPVVGKLLCELSLDEEPSHSTAPFAITRFPGVLRAAL
ncbi:peroxisomal sarcosine oxidase [Cuculus canorus]|uniref:peroxisomal sarcosine oxidase n=1 Tax=Cuculus canorus TaxID=55661 RepID=UPI0023AA8907|nr:peroxisomal sarcosine oxidase [Cuculus canorus]